jgi:hypothetical protein
MRKREMTLVIGISGLNPQWGFSQTSDDGLKNRGVTDIFVAGVAKQRSGLQTTLSTAAQDREKVDHVGARLEKSCSTVLPSSKTGCRLNS